MAHKRALCALLLVLHVAVGYKFDITAFGNIRNHGYYYALMNVGSPPQPQAMIIDTGSTITTAGCAECRKNCGQHIFPLYDPDQSRSVVKYGCHSDKCKLQVSSCDFRGKKCLFSQLYAEGSRIHGYYIDEQISFHNDDPSVRNDVMRMPHFGCGTVETNAIYSQKPNGIVGLSFARVGVQSTMVELALENEDAEHKIMSMCLSDEGGRVTIGRSVAELYSDTERVVWTKIIQKELYMIRLQALQFEPPHTDALSDLSQRFSSAAENVNAVVDSGTTFSYLPEHVFHRLSAQLYAHCAPGPYNDGQRLFYAKGLDASAAPVCRLSPTDGVCFEFPQPLIDPAQRTKFLSALPSFVLDFTPESPQQQARVRLSALTYLYDKTATTLCTGFRSYNENRIFLGLSLLKNQLVFVDRSNDRIGFAQTICPRHTFREQLLTQAKT